MKVGPFTDGDRDRDWLPEDIWASIPQYLHHSIERRAARHRLAAVSAVPAVVDLLAEREAIMAWLSMQGAEADRRVRDFHTGSLAERAPDVAADLCRFAAAEAATYRRAATAIGYDAHASYRPAEAK